MERYVTTLIALVTLCACLTHFASAQPLTSDVPVSASCLELNQRAIAQIEDGRISEAEATLSASSAKIDGLGYTCAGVVLNNMAAVMSASGRLSEAAGFAERSIRTFREGYSSDSAVFLRPLAILAAARFKEGHTASVRTAFQQMQLIRIERPKDRAIFDGIAASLLSAEGRWNEAESEYKAATAAWSDAGLGQSSDAAAVLNGLGVLYIREERWNDAERILDRAFAMIVRAPDATPIDRIYVLDARGVVHARLGKWKDAEEELSQAVAIADQNAHVAPIALLSLLINYSAVLKKNHRRRDAQVIDARIASLQRTTDSNGVVDVTELVAASKSMVKSPPKKATGGK